MSQITIPREELEQVLEALESIRPLMGGFSKKLNAAISTLRARLEQPEQRPEPVAFRYKFGLTDTVVKICGDMTHMLKQCTIAEIGGTAKYGEVTWLYASPPQPEKHPELSEAIAAEREACARLCESYAMPDISSETAVLLAAAIRARGGK